VQVSPGPHAGPVPHWHWPCDEQEFADGAVQAWQPAPFTPHWAAVEVWHWLVEQHPRGHDAAVQLQTPPWHSWPGGHGPLLPHWQEPWEQLSERRSHVLQDAPFCPHCPVVVAFTQVAPLQQPVQVLGSHLHVPLTTSQTWPMSQGGFVPHLQAPLVQALALRVVQSVQLAALAPHWVTVGGVTHPWEVQQPLGHIAEVQPEHCP
jgi:hypothetical protein